MTLDSGTLRLLRLALKEADKDGWAKVSKLVWPLVVALPADLTELRGADDGGGYVKLTDRGDAVVMYS